MIAPDIVVKAESPTSGHPALPVLDISPVATGSSALRRQIVQYAPGVLLPAVLSVASAAIFTRVFEAATYGRFSLAVSVAAVVVLLNSQWLQQGVTRFVPATPPGEQGRRLRRGIGLALLVVAAGTGVSSVAVSIVGLVVLPHEWRPVMWSGIAYVMANVLFGPLSAILQSDLRARRYSVYIVATSVLRLLCALVLVFFVSRDVSYLLWAPSAALAVALPWLWRDASFPSVRTLIMEWRTLWPEVRRLAAYGYPVVGWTIAANLLDGSDRWLIEFFRGSGEVGVYAANYSLVVGTVGVVALPMGLATHPFLMRAWGGGDRVAAGRWLGTIVEWYLISGTLLVGVIGFYSHDIATLLLGRSFHAGYRIIPIVLAGVIVWQLGMYSHKPLEFTERTGVMFGLCVAAAVLNVVLNLVVVPRFGYMGAACTSLVAYVAYTVAATVVGRRILEWTIQWRRVITALSITAAGLLLAGLLRDAAAARAGFFAGLGASAIIVLVTVTAVFFRVLRPMLRATAGPVGSP